MFKNACSFKNVYLSLFSNKFDLKGFFDKLIIVISNSGSSLYLVEKYIILFQSDIFLYDKNLMIKV